MNKKKNKAALSDESTGGLFPAINLLHDPQGTVEKVFRRLRQSKQRFEVRTGCVLYVVRYFWSQFSKAHRPGYSAGTNNRAMVSWLTNGGWVVARPDKN